MRRPMAVRRMANDAGQRSYRWPRVDCRWGRLHCPSSGRGAAAKSCRWGEPKSGWASWKRRGDRAWGWEAARRSRVFPRSANLHQTSACQPPTTAAWWHRRLAAGGDPAADREFRPVREAAKHRPSSRSDFRGGRRQPGCTTGRRHRPLVRQWSACPRRSKSAECAQVGRHVARKTFLAERVDQLRLDLDDVFPAAAIQRLPTELHARRRSGQQHVNCAET